MIIRAIDRRYLGHPFIFSIPKERPWQRLSPASKFIKLQIHTTSTGTTSKTLILEQQSPAAAGFSFSGSTTLVQERWSAAGLDFPSLIVQL